MDNPHNTQELGIGWLYVITHDNAQGLVDSRAEMLRDHERD